MQEKPKKNNSSVASRPDALVNECKGNLFEYLVGLHLSKIYHIEAAFLEHIDPNYKGQLKVYESVIRKIGGDLSLKLDGFASQTALHIKEKIKSSPLKILVIGKMPYKGEYGNYKEADLLLITPKENLPISLKMAKNQSYVNTKSGGAKSFLEKYFSSYDNCKNYQAELNRLIDRNYFEMGHQLYQMIGEEFPGNFAEIWDNHGYSHLPGRLDVSMKKVVFKNYQKTNQSIYQYIKQLSEDRDRFSEALMPLVGIGHRDLLLVIGFTSKDRNEKSQLERILIYDYDLLKKEVEAFSLSSLDETISSFEIHFSSFKLQIRIKPMNEFTTPSYKINCSVKFTRQ